MVSILQNQGIILGTSSESLHKSFGFGSRVQIIISRIERFRIGICVFPSQKSGSRIIFQDMFCPIPKKSFQHLSEQMPDMCCSLCHAGAFGNSLWITISGCFLSKTGLYVLLQLGHLRFIPLSILYHAPCFTKGLGAFQL